MKIDVVWCFINLSKNSDVANTRARRAARVDVAWFRPFALPAKSGRIHAFRLNCSDVIQAVYFYIHSAQVLVIACPDSRHFRTTDVCLVRLLSSRVGGQWIVNAGFIGPCLQSRVSSAWNICVTGCLAASCHQGRMASFVRRFTLSSSHKPAGEVDMSTVMKRGTLKKKGHIRRNWLERWFVLSPGGLYYYKDESVRFYRSFEDKKLFVMLF